MPLSKLELISLGEMALGFDEGLVDAASSCRQADVASDGRQLGIEVAEWRWPFLGAIRWGGDDDRIGVLWDDGTTVGCRCCRALLLLELDDREVSTRLGLSILPIAHGVSVS